MPSYSPVFSAPFVQYSAATPNETFDVPSGFTAVVRQITCTQDIGTYIAYVFIADSVGGPGIIIDAWNSTGVNVTHHQEGRWVVPGGGVISIYFNDLGDAPYFYVGGYLLRDTLT